VCFLSVLPCYVLCTSMYHGAMGDSGYRSPPVRSVGVKGLWHGGLCEIACCVWRSMSGFEEVAQFYMLILGEGEFGGGVYFIGQGGWIDCTRRCRTRRCRICFLNGLAKHDGKFQLSMQHMVCERLVRRCPFLENVV
jgi:hypothetical protein